jgi:hypothetical protein
LNFTFVIQSPQSEQKKLKQNKMKKILLMWVSVSLSTFFAQAQPVSQNLIAAAHTKHPKEAKSSSSKKHAKKILRKLAGSNVSEQSKATFYVQFGNVPDVQWERQDYFDMATFIQNGQQMKAYFDNDGELVGTSIQTNMKALPMKAQLEIAKKYGDYSIGDVILYDDNNEQISDIILFGTQMESADNYFVELKKDNKRVILEVSPEARVSLFREGKD